MGFPFLAVKIFYGDAKEALMKSSLPLEPPVDVQEFAAENAASQGKSGAGNALVSVFLKFNMNFSLKYERNYSII